MKTYKNFDGQYIYSGKKHWDDHGFVIDHTGTEHYRDKEEVDDGTWYFDKTGSGAYICWFIPKE